MKKKFFLFILLFIVFNIKDVYAYSADDYQYRNLCGNYELAEFHSDGMIVGVGCFDNYDAAKAEMEKSGREDLAIMTKVKGKSKIINANSALLDLSVNPATLTYFYRNSDLSGSAYTYMDTGSLYGGVDGAHISTGYSMGKAVWTSEVKIGNFRGWISEEAYEIVPITWVKSKSSYTITNDSIRHNYVAKIQNTYNGNGGRVIGPKPSMLSTGTYYSYDGHYFYDDIKKLISDYKAGNYNNSVNKDKPYYNYYMYLSNHTKTTYSSVNIDEYIRNNLGKTQDVFGNSASSNTSRLYGAGTYFYYAQQKHGVNAILSLSLSRNETGNGTSNLAINKNNGFGLNAADSNPYEAANWYASFPSSILGYASKWITNGYAHPRDWRYFGPQFGDKFIGMNVKYASDTYWSEKMAANYYAFDKAKGLQDYDYYQLGVVTRQTQSYSSPSTSSKKVYVYPEAEDALVIVGETKGTSVDGNSTWYEVISDLNIDSNYDEKSGDYNWDATVFVPAAYVKKINNGKNGYVSPNSVTEYQDSDYTYNLLVENANFKPKVGLSKKDTDFYYDSSLTSRKGQVLKSNRYVMIYSIAYDANGNTVAYQVTSDYKFQQKHWVSADSIKVVEKTYGRASVTVSGNQYTWVNSEPLDTKATLISGLYTYAYVPILEQKTVDGALWYRVPVDISGNTNEFGWTLASAPGVNIEILQSIAENNAPVIEASDKNMLQGTKFNPMDGVTANDTEDGNITSSVKVKENNVNIDKPGTYSVVYEVKDSSDCTTQKTISVVITENKKPVIEADDITIKQGNKIKESFKAYDEEDGNLTNKVKKTKDDVDTSKPGVYEITYEVEDSYKQKATKTIKVTILKDEMPQIIVEKEEITLTKDTEFKKLDGVSAKDEEDGDLTKNIEVIENTVNTKKTGEYKVVYQVKDSYGNKTEKTIKVTVVKNQLPVIEATDKKVYLNSEFDPKSDISARDEEDGDITKKIEVVSDVNTKEEGKYTVTYKVKDSYGNEVEKTITVEVVKKVLKEEDGEFYLNELSWNKNNKEYTISGYLIILNQDNNSDKKYELILKDKNNDKEHKVNVASWKKDVPYDLGEDNGKSYVNSWFKGKLNLKDIPNGDYDLYMRTEQDEYYSEELVTNILNKDIDKRAEDETHGYNFRVLLNLRSKMIQLSIRDELYTVKVSPTFRNMVNDYDEFKFNDNKLFLRGTSYNYAATYDNKDKIKRKLIIENQSTFKQYYYDLTTLKDASYKVETTDNKSKDYAWYEEEIDISKLEKGTYTLQVYTKTIDAEDYGEITDVFGTMQTIEKTISGKKYTIKLNKERQNRVEIIVE